MPREGQYWYMTFAKLSFVGDRIELDGNEYRACTFKDCVLEYRGGKVEFAFCTTENTTLECSPAAAQTLESLGLQQLANLRRP